MRKKGLVNGEGVWALDVPYWANVSLGGGRSKSVVMKERLGRKCIQDED